MNARTRQVITMLAAATVLALLSNAQQRAPVHRMKIFAAPDGTFQFSHPGDYRVCTEEKLKPCIHSYIQVCEQDALVCVIYPAKRFAATNFGSASFQVREIHTERETMTPDVCVTPYPRKAPDSTWPEFLISARHPGEMIGGVLFVHGVSDTVAMSHSISVDVYRAFQKEKCFELSVSETVTSPAVTDPPMKTLTSAQRNELDDGMSQILHSFRFLK